MQPVARLRLKQQLKVRDDKDVAVILGMSAAALNMRKKRGNFPETELYALAAKRPDLRLDVGLVLHGDRLTPDQRTALAVTAAYPPAGIPDAAAEVANAFLELNARRKGQYQQIVEVLNGCSDETVALVVQLVVRLYHADRTT
ncbi:hypothetical protein FACS1894116_07080 [Betaproteobacteria bacterium]|nr:hypothetical protein FACS1894116_07080 [Betaproteobacteria bacterium]GHU25014.1 hypothetical protein FACS189488_10950 [Betaproteobacteria bacterium]